MSLKFFAIFPAFAIAPIICKVPDQARAQVWSLEKTPARLRPRLCTDVRKQISYDISTSSYRYAMKRKQNGTLWPKHKRRLAYSAELQDTYRRLDCRNY
jgi:hypothetical protein